MVLPAAAMVFLMKVRFMVVNIGFSLHVERNYEQEVKAKVKMRMRSRFLTVAVGVADGGLI